MDSYIRTYNNPIISTKVNNASDYETLLLTRNANIKSDFSILHNNIRSISKNFDEFSVFLSQFRHQFDCIVFSETRHVLDFSFFQIPGYEILYNNGQYNKCDGVIVYIKNSINYTSSVINLGDALSLQINFERKKFRIISVYKSPQIRIEEFNIALKTYLESISRSDYTILVGDVNI